MWKLLAALTAAGALARAAGADIAPPVGFTLSPVLSKPATFVAGKPARVYCADTQAHFNAADKQYTGIVLGAGFSQIGGSQTFLAPWVCSYLNRWLAKKPLTLRHFAVVLVALIHEAELEKGTSDESLADCQALAIMPTVVKKFFPLRGVYTMHDLMRDAWDVHNGEPGVYLTNCPPR
jgi:hypothetical protein